MEASEFIENPTALFLSRAGKEVLCDFAKKWKLSGIQRSMTKAEIRRKIAEYCVGKELFEEESLQEFPIGDEETLLRLEQLRMERLKFEAAEAEKQRVEAEKQREFEREMRRQEGQVSGRGG